MTRYFMLVLSLAALHAGAILQPAGAQRTDGVLPRFRAAYVAATRDTTWFLPGPLPEGARGTPAVAYVPGLGRWITTELTWRQVERYRSLNTWSGSYPPVSDYALRDGLSLVRGQPTTDPRHVDSTDAQDHPMERVALRMAGVDYELGPRVPESARRALYLNGGGQLEPGQAAPPFNQVPSRWAMDSNMVALAIPAAPPPQPEAPWLPVRDEDTEYDVYLSGILLFDSQRRVSTPVVHSRLIEHAWTGMEFASGALWVTPTTVEGGDVEWTDAPARRVPPRLARYDLTRRTWGFLDSSAVPLRSIIAMAGDGRRLYFVSADGVATLDTRTMRWDTRYYADSAYRLADGADTCVTRLGTTPVISSDTRALTYGERLLLLADRFEPRLPDDSINAAAGEDSVATMAAFAAELGVRHHSDLVRDLLRFAPYDTVSEIVVMMDAQRGGRWDTGDIYATEAEAAMEVLRRPQFHRYLREAMWKSASQAFAFEALRPAGRAALASAARATLDSGTDLAAVYAADSLIAWGDPAGDAWLRLQISNPERLIAGGHEAMPTVERILDLFARRMVARGDSTWLPPLLRVLDAAGPVDAGNLSRFVLRLRGAGWEARVARALETRPALWEHWLATLDRDTLLFHDPVVRGSASRAAAALLSMRDSLAEVSFAQHYAGRYPRPSRTVSDLAIWARTASVLRVAARLDARPLVPALAQSAAVDTTLLYWKVSELIRLTGDEGAPPYASPRTPAEYRALQVYWSGWWRAHGARFVQPSRSEGQAALRRWSARSVTRRP